MKSQYKNTTTCWIYLLPTPILQMIYEYDATFRDIFRETMTEYKYNIQYTDKIQLRGRFYQNLLSYSCTSYGGRIQTPMYSKVPYLLPGPSPDRSNLINWFDLYCFRFPFYERIKKRDSIKPFLAYKNTCKYCGTEGIRASRYKLRQPFEMYMFCGYHCHQQFYVSFMSVNTRPVFDQYGLSTMAKCAYPNYWKLREKDEQWEIV
jgi:hypothetical protein